MIAEKIQLVTRHFLVALAYVMCSFGAVSAGDLTVAVTDDKGKPLADSVVLLTPKFALSGPVEANGDTVMQQQNTLFDPFVLPVQTGTRVSFPNLDEARHHVYSFSKAKPFELRLYGKDESNSIEFETPGVVALGCNIHDNMLAYIYVTDASIYLKTDESGVAAFEGLEDGNYDVEAWHPGLRNGEELPGFKDYSVTGEKSDLTIGLKLRRVWGQQRPAAEGQY